MMSIEEDEKFMRIALEEAAAAAAEGEVPIGAVMVREGVVVAKEHNRVESEKLGSAHAELLCIEAARSMSPKSLAPCAQGRWSTVVSDVWSSVAETRGREPRAVPST